MTTLDRIQNWWSKQTSPGEVGVELAWRGYVVNSLILSLGIFSFIYFIITIIQWIFSLDDGGSVMASFGLFLVCILLLWVSKNKSIPLAVFLFSLVSAGMGVLLTVGWGVGDIAGAAVYAGAIMSISVLLRGRAATFLLMALITGYFLFGWAEFIGLFTPPFFTKLSANHFNVGAILIFLVFWGVVTARMIDRTMNTQIEEAAHRQELESRNQIAAEVQLSMLPTDFPSQVGYLVAGQSIPAREVGGDFFTYYSLVNNTLAVVVGDVTGKGMPAALLMAVSVGMIDGLAPIAREPVALINEVGARLKQYTSRNGLNAACLVAFFHGNTIQVSNAGGVEPIIRKAGGEIIWLSISGPPLGLEIEYLMPYKQVEAILAPEDMVIFVTDGIVENRNSGGEMLGFERLENIISAGPSNNAEAMRAYILEQANIFGGDILPEDDVTVVVIQIKETPQNVS